MKLLFVWFLVIMTSSSWSKECKRLDWTYEDSRTQGGGWIWFPSKGESSSLSLATLKAEGGALEYLKGECGIVPEETKFNEKCVEEVDGKYIVHMRTAIRQQSCNSQSRVSAELTKRLLNYQSMNAISQVNPRLCNPANAEACYVEADKEWRLKNIALAIAYADLACNYGDIYSCGFLGYLHFELGNVPQARKNLAYACKNGINVSCKELKDLESQLKRI